VTLLQDIQDAAAGDVPIEVLLRKMLLLANRLGNDDVARWARAELAGYFNVEDAEVPQYRRRAVAIVGVVSNGYAEREMPLPPDMFHERVREMLSMYRFNQGVSELERMAAAEGDYTRVLWPRQLVDFFQEQVSDGWQFTQITYLIQHATITQVLAAIRTRALEFAMQIEHEDPNAGDDRPASDAVPQEQVSHVFNTTIYGGTNNIAMAGHDATATSSLPTAAQFNAAAAELKALGVAEGDIEELRGAVMADAAEAQGSSEPMKFGPRVRGWLGRLALSSAEAGATDLTTGAAAVVLKHLGA